MQYLTRREDFLFPIEAHFNKIFDQLLVGNSLKDSIKATQGYPKMDVFEEKENLVIKVAVPGLKIEDLNVEFNSNNSQVTISGKMSSQFETQKDSKFYVKELRQSYFCRSVNLPEYAVNDPEAFLEDGILTLKWKIPKPEIEKEQVPKKITVKQNKK
jgi:HSP20 family protein